VGGIAIVGKAGRFDAATLAYVLVGKKDFVAGAVGDGGAMGPKGCGFLWTKPSLTVCCEEQFFAEGAFNLTRCHCRFFLPSPVALVTGVAAS